MKKYLFVAVFILILVFLLWLGFEKIAGVLGLGGLAYEESKRRIERAGEEHEAENFDNADNAANYIDDIIDDDDSK